MPCTIPNIFHLTAKKKNDLPLNFLSNISRIKELYPDHEIRIHDDDDIRDLFKSQMPEYYEDIILNMPKFIMAVDTARYLWMHLYGGVYCDMDVYFRKRLDFQEGVVFIEREWTWPKDNSIRQSVHNCLFASAPKHPVWIEILDGIAANVSALKGKRERKKATSGIGKQFERVLIKAGLGNRYFPAVFNITGPNAISKIITDRDVTARYSDVKVMPCSILFQAGLSKGFMEQAHVVHQTAGSWNSESAAS